MRLPATGLLSVALSWACGGSSEASSTTTSTASAESSAPAPAASRPSADKGMDWNDAEVDWVDLETGLARAKAEDRPLVLVVYTTWCPRCLELSREWKDPALVAAAKSAIMVRMNGDTEPVANERFSPDGSYIPRTMLVNPDGSVQTDVVGPNEGYRYFHTDAATLLPLLEATRGS